LEEAVDGVGPRAGDEPAGSGAADLARVVTAAFLCVLVAFLVFEGLEEALAPADPAAHVLHYVRGISASLFTALVVGWVTHRNNRRRAVELEAEVARRTREADAAREQLQVVVDTTPAALLVLDRDRRVVQANRTAATVHGLPPVGRTCHELIAARADPCPECGLGQGVPGSPPRCHTDARTGEVLAVESHPLLLPNGEAGVLLVEQVVTEQRKLQARLLHQEKMAAFGLLAAGVAHEMGNPLSSIEAQLQLLSPHDLRGQAPSVVATVRQEVARLGRILRELVDFARRRRDEPTLVSVQSVVSDALRLLRHDRRMRAVKVREEFDPETPPVFVVEDHLMQVVLNLLLNALDAMPAGGSLRVEVGAADGQVALRVHDSGTGMDRAVLARCFEPLFTTKEPGRGTGLGLSISRDIARAAGGEIELHSAPDRGTSAVVTLPAFAEAPAPVRAADEVRSPAAPVA
jgi:signal transduction histidine kinase